MYYMKTYILVSGDCKAINAEDIKVNEIIGIYQNESKAFWECREINLKIKKKNLKYVLKEINLDTNEIVKSYMLDGNDIVDNDGKKYKIPVFYDDINKKKYSFQ